MHYNDAAREQVRVCDVRQQNMPNNQQTCAAPTHLSLFSLFALPLVPLFSFLSNHLPPSDPSGIKCLIAMTLLPRDAGFANDDRALMFWNSLPDQLPPVGTAYSVPALGGEMLRTQAIYVRPCYHDLARICTGLKMSAIVGTPGIGKSLFLQFFIAYLKSAGVKRIVLARPIEHKVYTFDRTSGTTIAMCWSTASYYASDYAKHLKLTTMLGTCSMQRPQRMIPQQSQATIWLSALRPR